MALFKPHKCTGGAIAFGSYVGDGTFGTANPNSLTFDFVPKMVSIYAVFESDGDFHNVGDGSYNNYLANVPMEELTTEYKNKYGFGYGAAKLYAKKSDDGKTVSWYHDSDEDANGSEQMNANGTKYFYMALA